MKGSSKHYGRHTQRKLSDQIRSAWGQQTGLLSMISLVGSSIFFTLSLLSFSLNLWRVVVANGLDEGYV